MKAIHKFPLTIGTNWIEVDEGAEALCVQMQRGVLCLWALVDVNDWRRKVAVNVYGTGQLISGYTKKESYIGTVQDGDCVWHVFGKLAVEATDGK